MESRIFIVDIDVDRKDLTPLAHVVYGTMDWTLFNKFKKQFHLAKKAAEDVPQTNIGFSIQYDKEKGGSSSLNLPPEKDISRFAAVLRPLADSDSPLYFRKVAETILENNLVDLSDLEKAELHKRIKDVEDGPLRFKVNDDAELTASGLYKLYSRGEYFSEQTDEAAKILEYKKVPLANRLILFNFYSYCCDVYRISWELYNLIRQAEKNISKSITISTSEKGSPQCIYCLSRMNNFKSEEHVYPESLGNSEVVLPPGCVCDVCNNGVLSNLDNYLVNHEGISFLRVLYVPYNPKTGKFPRARYQNMTIEKSHPRKIDFHVHGNVSKSVKTNIDGDMIRGKFKTIGRKFNPRLLGRSLYKIGLGIVCWRHGPEVALDKKYDQARGFILGKQAFPNNLIMQYECIPCEEIGSEHHIMNRGTIFELSIFGLHFLFNLEPEPIIKMTSELEKLNCKLFSLSS